MSTPASDTTDCGLSSDVIIGIPAYNEAETVGDVVSVARENGVAVVVVDDGSDDRTADVAREAGATVVSHEVNRGYGAALETLFQTAYEQDVEHLVVVDADGQHDPADAMDLVETQRSTDGDVVIGSRFVAGSETKMPLYRRFGLTVINGLVGSAMRLGYSAERVADTQSGFRAYNADAIEMLACRADLSHGMDTSLDILFHAAAEDCSFNEMPVDVRYDVGEANTHNPVLHGGVLVRNVLTRVFSDRPARMLAVPGFVCLVLGGLLSRTPLTSYAVFSAALPLLIPLLLLLGGGGLVGAALAFGRRSPSRD